MKRFEVVRQIAIEEIIVVEANSEDEACMLASDRDESEWDMVVGDSSLYAVELTGEEV